ncbi:hypothetical protein [Lysobacter enzymogenes]|uniref:hypothetical protein n=1 Tax=Lysobacter enzymogenes TaxID=69 RepID=UPI0019CFCFEA|nr:hypothetical protein [Lysobacter enzymogenes]
MDEYDRLLASLPADQDYSLIFAGMSAPVFFHYRRVLTDPAYTDESESLRAMFTKNGWISFSAEGERPFNSLRKICRRIDSGALSDNEEFLDGELVDIAFAAADTRNVHEIYQILPRRAKDIFATMLLSSIDGSTDGASDAIKDIAKSLKDSLGG